MSTTNNRKDKTKKLAHIFAGIIILVHAYEKYELDEGSWLIFLTAGIAFLLVAILHHRLVYIFPYVDGVFFFIEAILCAFIAVDYFVHGKKGLPWCYVIASAAYLFAAFIKGKKGKAIHQKNIGG
jgi:hypothetical protein